MIVFIKKILFKLLPQKAYLKTLHRSFYLLYSLGFLKNDPRFKYHYLVKDILQEDDVVVDIGANLGYFAKTFSRLVANGQLICIEPVKPFYDILIHFLGSKKNLTIYNCALGNEEGMITMVLPESNGMIRTGLPHIAQSEEEKRAHKTHEVKIVRGSELLSDLPKIDYIKCDIEGYEVVVFNEMKPIIERFKPTVQIEIGPENETEMIAYFKGLDYIQYGVAHFKIIREVNDTQQEQGDFLFVHTSKSAAFETLMQSKNRF